MSLDFLLPELCYKFGWITNEATEPEYMSFSFFKFIYCNYFKIIL